MMLVAIKYFELIQKGTKESALNTLLGKFDLNQSNIKESAKIKKNLALR